ncbi:MAG TPA: M23 family metallopeptidase, partial [Bacteroidota bacterium]|nr:M23 family metallopeptidase [Bacteroidota bacterium]
MNPAREAATALLLCAMLGTARAGDTKDGYCWPLPSGRTVTSTFGEYRPGHFHAGIDISSGDVAAEPVVAARAGVVARIIISPTGYGKMLEIRHDDGFTTVYAHLERFAPALEERASAAQARLGRYPVDVACAPGEFPVAAGDLVAYTGSTGAASPHLHFEVRDPRGDPVNPFRWPGLRAHDTIAPVIRRIAVIPVDPDATVDGSHSPRTLRADEHARTVVVTGRVGLAVAGRDRIPGSRFLNGVYARTLFLDGAPVFSERLDATPWRETHEIELCYERGIPGGGRYARLFINSPNHLRTYAPPLPTAGIIDAQALTPGPHAVRILCADYAGNTAEARLSLVAGRP